MAKVAGPLSIFLLVYYCEEESILVRGRCSKDHKLQLSRIYPYNAI